MAYTVEKLLEIARNEIGYIEKETNRQLDNKTANAGDENYTKYARDLYNAGYYNGNKNGYAWCDVFHDYCHYIAAGKNAKLAQEVTCQTGDCGAGCRFSAQYYKEQNRFYTSNPQPGDQIFFNNYAHTGIVEKIENGIVTTIEGNTSDRVARRTYRLGSSSIDGYGRPKYDVSTSSPAPTISKKSVNEIAKEVIQGKWGNGENRKARLTAAGYNYSEVQNAVNTLLSVGNKKTVEQIAKEVIQGKWDNGAARRQKLEAAGYNYAEVQKKVNELLR